MPRSGQPSPPTPGRSGDHFWNQLAALFRDCNKRRCTMMIQAILDRKGSTVFTIHPTATVRSAIDQMHKRGVAALVVEGATGVPGIVSERNAVSAISQY